MKNMCNHKRISLLVRSKMVFAHCMMPQLLSLKLIGLHYPGLAEGLTEVCTRKKIILSFTSHRWEINICISICARINKYKCYIRISSIWHAILIHFQTEIKQQTPIYTGFFFALCVSFCCCANIQINELNKCSHVNDVFFVLNSWPLVPFPTSFIWPMILSLPLSPFFCTW